MIDWKWITGIAATIIVGVGSIVYLERKRKKKHKLDLCKPREEQPIPQNKEIWKK